MDEQKEAMEKFESLENIKKSTAPLTLSEDEFEPVAIHLSELKDRPDVTLRDEDRLIQCPHCDSPHPLEFGEDGPVGEDETKFQKSAFLGTIMCLKEGNEVPILVVAGNKLLPGIEFYEKKKFSLSRKQRIALATICFLGGNAIIFTIPFGWNAIGLPLCFAAGWFMANLPKKETLS
jgi:hypothetical protein